MKADIDQLIKDLEDMYYNRPLEEIATREVLQAYLDRQL